MALNIIYTKYHIPTFNTRGNTQFIHRAVFIYYFYLFFTASVIWFLQMFISQLLNVYVHKHMQTHMYILKYIYTVYTMYMFGCMYICIDECMHIHTKYGYVCVYIYVRVCAYTLYICKHYIYVNIYMCLCMCMCFYRHILRVNYVLSSNTEDD